MNAIDGTGGCTILLTGLPAAGKSTLAESLVARIAAAGRKASLLDGDELRSLLSPDLGYTRADRILQCRRAGFIAGEVARHGGISVCALVAPYHEAREELRRLSSAQGRFLMVYVATPVEVCMVRDRKGLYARARAGVITDLTGVGESYEVPSNPDVVIDMSRTAPDSAATTVLEKLIVFGYLGQALTT